MTQDLDQPPLYEAIVNVRAENVGAEVTTDVVAMCAWERLSGQQRREALPMLLTVFAMRVHDEEHSRQLDAAARDETHTYLAEFDMAMLWDSAATPANAFGEVPADIDSLRNVLCELELLQHRLAMRDNDQEGK